MSSAILPSEGRIVMVKEPVSGRFGVHKLMAHLTMNTYGTAWDGDETITLVTFNVRGRYYHQSPKMSSYLAFFLRHKNAKSPDFHQI